MSPPASNGMPTLVRTLIFNHEVYLAPLLARFRKRTDKMIHWRFASRVQVSIVMSNQANKSWGGRFAEPTDAFVEAFTASIGFDHRLAQLDLAGSRAHARMLMQTGILGQADGELILTGLDALEQDLAAGKLSWSVAAEDIHMNLEAQLIDRIGEAGKRLHTARSRNDQVATDLRLYTREAIDHLETELRRLQTGLLDLAEVEAETIMPGFTHLQAAQPVTFGHHMLAWLEMLERDRERLLDARKRVNTLPLGAAALAGTGFPIDRQYTTELLGFERPAANSLDAVSDRDFALEVNAAGAILMVHLSRFAEELILWNATPFGFVQLPDRFCTGSSIMPQKKNPDVPELIRGKAGRVFGHLMGLLTLMKAQPLAYNKDNQEDKEPLFDTLDTLTDSLRAFADLIPHLRVDRERMHAAARAGYATATDLADYLVRKGMAFRDAHAAVGQAVQHGLAQGLDLAEMDLQTLQGFAACIEADVYDILTVEGSVASRDHVGGTAPAQVRRQIEYHRKRLARLAQ